MNLKYRPEIDGLRAVAVLPVILFHAGFTTFGGGFVGVDVFFVISGYLITSIIVKDVAAGTFSVWDFYERRARRILPALFLVILCCIPFAWMWMYPKELKAFATSVVAVCLFASNFLFWRQSGYFDTAAELKPLLHTWSLAVEEQYYIIFPVAILLLWRRGRRNVIWSITLVAVLSLALSEYGSRYHPSANFYLLPTRAWELMAGALCSFAINRPSILRDNVLSLTGLAAIAVSVFAFDETIPFPSAYALIPVLGTCAILLFARQGTLVGSLLSQKPIVGIGLISYSAYLWHQPLFAFARIRSVSEPAWQMMLALAAASIVLAYLSWRFVEMPARRRGAWPLPNRRTAFATLGLVAAACIAAGMAGRYTNGFPTLSRFDAKIQKFARFMVDHDIAYFNRSCFLYSGQDSFSFFKTDKCLALSRVKPNILIIGDSHAAHLVKAIAGEFPGVNVMQATASGCKPILPLTGEKRCTDLMSFVFSEFLPNNPLDGIIVSANWSEEDAQGLPATLEALRTYATSVSVIGPTMTYSTDLPRILASIERDGTDDIARAASMFSVADRWKIDSSVKRAAGAGGAHYIDILDELCTDRICRVLSDENDPIAYDYGHFTESGARLIVRRLKNDNKFDGIMR